MATRKYDDGDGDVPTSNALGIRMATTSLSFLLSYLTVEEMSITMNKNPGKTCSIIEFLRQATHIFALPINHRRDKRLTENSNLIDD
ncbi:MAG TPA: hypothetical protein VF172_03180 [Nitrososphaera sp.]